MSLIASAYAAQAATANGDGSLFGSMLMIGGFILIFYLLILRPQNQRAREQEELITGLRVGDEVVTSGGILGRITHIRGDFLIVALTENVEVTVQKSAVKGTIPRGSIKTL